MRGGELIFRRMVILAILLGAAAGLHYLYEAKNSRLHEEARGEAPASGDEVRAAAVEDGAPRTRLAGSALPRLVDIGARKCRPCKAMQPILEQLREEYRGIFDVVFIDVWESPEAAKQYRVRLIPTQIFFDTSGRELFRHEGFFSKEGILAAWKALGIDLKKRT